MSFILFSDTIEHITQSTRGLEGVWEVDLWQRRNDWSKATFGQKSYHSDWWMNGFFKTCYNKLFVHFIGNIKKHIFINSCECQRRWCLSHQLVALTSTSNSSVSVYDVFHFVYSSNVQVISAVKKEIKCSNNVSESYISSAVDTSMKMTVEEIVTLNNNHYY